MKRFTVATCTGWRIEPDNVTRVGGKSRPGCTAVVYDEATQRVVKTFRSEDLTRRQARRRELRVPVTIRLAEEEAARLEALYGCEVAA